MKREDITLFFFYACLVAGTVFFNGVKNKIHCPPLPFKLAWLIHYIKIKKKNITMFINYIPFQCEYPPGQIGSHEKLYVGKIFSWV